MWKVFLYLNLFNAEKNTYIYFQKRKILASTVSTEVHFTTVKINFFLFPTFVKILPQNFCFSLSSIPLEILLYLVSFHSYRINNSFQLFLTVNTVKTKILFVQCLNPNKSGMPLPAATKGGACWRLISNYWWRFISKSPMPLVLFSYVNSTMQ